MQENLLKIKQQAQAALSAAADLKALEDVRVTTFGKKGELTRLLRGMGNLSAEERPIIGQLVNDLKEELELAFEAKKAEISSQEQAIALATEQLDVTLPGIRQKIGNRHPVSIVTEEICRIFMGMGYAIAEGPEIETDYHNFEALNVYKGHPARDEQDTFYVEGGLVLRTQTSPVQIRFMENNKPPIAIVAPGKVFRSDQVTAKHSPVFHQIEGLVVDKGINMGHLKGALTVFAKELFGAEVQTRFRPHHFPFTEPSAEMDVACFACDGTNHSCRICKGEGWVELLGCGMVHPDVLKRCDVDPAIYSGFAFGMGIDRVAMARFNIPDMRLLFENDVKFLNQF